MAAACECEKDGNIPINVEDVRHKLDAVEREVKFDELSVAMRVIVVGLGVQGHKRRRFAGSDFVCSVDAATRRRISATSREVPLDTLRCRAGLHARLSRKSNSSSYLLEQRQARARREAAGAADARRAGAARAATRAQPASFSTPPTITASSRIIVRMRDLVASGALGDIYRCRMFYGNGTARLVRNSEWRDQGAGVLDDLGSHVLDTARFWFGDIGDEFSMVSADRFENRSAGSRRVRRAARPSAGSNSR